MTEAQATTDRMVKWLRYSARALAVTWALSVTLCWLFGVTLPSTLCAYDLGATDTAFRLPAWLTAVTVVLVPWIAAAIPWRRERAGAVVVLFLSVLVPIAHLYLSEWVYPTWGVGPWSSTCLWTYYPLWFVSIIPTVLPGLLAGMLFLISWRRSRTLAPPEATE
jgi:hypothetical protein